MKFLNMDESLHGYLMEKSVKENPVLEKLRYETGKLEQGIMQISPVQGQFMGFMTGLLGAEQILEIGTFTGYSTLCMALAGKGRVIACDVNREWTDIARKYWDSAGVADRIDLRLGPALETIETLKDKVFDLIFIDADKENYGNYFDVCLPLLADTGVMIFDNVLWGGSVIDPANKESSTEAIRNLNDRLYNEKGIEISMLPVSDGITLVRKVKD